MSGGLFYWLSTQRPRDHRHCRECRTQTHKRINTHIRFLKPHLGTTEQSALSDCSVKPCTADTTQCSAGLDPNRSLLSTSSLYWVSGITTFCMNSAWNDQMLFYLAVNKKLMAANVKGRTNCNMDEPLYKLRLSWPTRAQRWFIFRQWSCCPAGVVRFTWKCILF